MWRNKKWAIVIILAIVVVMAVGVIGGVVYAQSGSPAADSPNNPKDTLMSKVAEKLGVDQSALEDAFAEAQKELRQEAFNSRLDALVKQGKLTQEEADKYKEWIESRPDVPAIIDGQGFAPKGPMGFRGGPRCFPGMGKFGPCPQPPAPPETE